MGCVSVGKHLGCWQQVLSERAPRRLFLVRVCPSARKSSLLCSIARMVTEFGVTFSWRLVFSFSIPSYNNSRAGSAFVLSSSSRSDHHYTPDSTARQARYVEEYLAHATYSSFISLLDLFFFIRFNLQRPKFRIPNTPYPI